MIKTLQIFPMLKRSPTHNLNFASMSTVPQVAQHLAIFFPYLFVPCCQGVWCFLPPSGLRLCTLFSCRTSAPGRCAPSFSGVSGHRHMITLRYFQIRNYAMQSGSKRHFLLRCVCNVHARHQEVHAGLPAAPYPGTCPHAHSQDGNT